jgi:RNA polymerase sigma-70 factor, ECF subfamily
MLSPSEEYPDLTQLLKRMKGGDSAARDRLFEVIFVELRRIAASKLRHERPDHTLQPTALVNEVYLRLLKAPNTDWQDRAHFFATVGKVMRHILVDHARHLKAEKHGGAMERVEPLDLPDYSEQQREEVIAVHAALEKLEAVSQRQVAVVDLRFFSGFTEEEIAEMLGVTPRTIKRDWNTARAFLGGILGAS